LGKESFIIVKSFLDSKEVKSPYGIFIGLIFKNLF